MSNLQVTDTTRLIACCLLCLACGYRWGKLMNEPRISEAYRAGVAHAESKKNRDTVCFAYWFTESGNAATMRERVCGKKR